MPLALAPTDARGRILPLRPLSRRDAGRRRQGSGRGHAVCTAHVPFLSFLLITLDGPTCQSPVLYTHSRAVAAVLMRFQRWPIAAARPCARDANPEAVEAEPAHVRTCPKSPCRATCAACMANKHPCSRACTCAASRARAPLPVAHERERWRWRLWHISVWLWGGVVRPSARGAAPRAARPLLLLLAKVARAGRQVRRCAATCAPRRRPRGIPEGSHCVFGPRAVRGDKGGGSCAHEGGGVSGTLFRRKHLGAFL